MDIRKFLSTQSRNNTLDAAVDGFEKSSFVEQSQELSTLIKTLLNSMIRHSLTNNVYNPVITPADPPLRRKLHTFIRTNNKSTDNTASYLAQLQSGGITPNKNNKSGGTVNITSTFVNLDENDEIDSETAVIDVSKRQSYCTEFNQMIYNIQGLLGSEFAKFLFVIAGNKQLISNEIACIARCDNYSAIIYHLKRIKALVELSDTNERPTNNTNEFYNDNAEGITIDNAFWTSLAAANKRFVEPSLINEVDDPVVNTEVVFTTEWDKNLPTPVMNQLKAGYFNYNSVMIPKKTRFIDYIIKRVTEIVESDNILMFCEDRDNIHNLLTGFVQHIHYGKYFVNNIDDLVINMGCNGFVYDKSFLKMFEILFKETFADIPFKLWQPAFDPQDKDVEIDEFVPPYMQYIKNELRLDIKLDKYIDSFTKYYNKMFVETMQCIGEKLNKQSILNVVVTNKCYNLLAHVTFNMFVNLARRIANNQVMLIFFGKSTRIQFIQVFQGLLDCAPRNMLFSCTQRMMIHYILMSRKSLHESARSYDEVANLVKDSSDEKVKKKRGKAAVKKDAVDKSDNGSDKKNVRKRNTRKKKSEDEDVQESSPSDAEDEPVEEPVKKRRGRTPRKEESKKELAVMTQKKGSIDADNDSCSVDGSVDGSIIVPDTIIFTEVQSNEISPTSLVVDAEQNVISDQLSEDDDDTNNDTISEQLAEDTGIDDLDDFVNDIIDGI